MQPECQLIARLPRACVEQAETNGDVAECILIGEGLPGSASRYHVQACHALSRVLLGNEIPRGIQIVQHVKLGNEFILRAESGHQSRADLQPKPLLGIVWDAIECGFLDAVVKEAEPARGLAMGWRAKTRRGRAVLNGDDQRFARANRHTLQHFG